MTEKKDGPTGLALMRVPFPANQISKLPKQSKKQTDDRAGYVSCKVCGGWHHKNAVHLDYVGHAALTDRLLDCDPNWNWEPVATDDHGAPALDGNGGMWIRLTVCGVTRLGYGHPDGKRGGDAIKEVIGDALRNAAMRFGAALDLWHKGDLHGIEADDEPPARKQERPEPPRDDTAQIDALRAIADAADLPALQSVWQALPREVAAMPAVVGAKDARKLALTVDDEAPL